MNEILKTVGHHGGDLAAVLMFDEDGPALLPYATLVARAGQDRIGTASHRWGSTNGRASH